MPASLDPIVITIIAGAGALVIGILVTATILRKAVTRKAKEKLQLAEAEGESLKKERRNFPNPHGLSHPSQ